MASMKYRWWEDTRFLNKMNLQSNLDIIGNRVMFRKIYDTGNRQYWALYVAETKALEDGEITPEFLQRYFEEIHTHSPEYRHEGPTNRELEIPSVRLAWQEFQLVRRLASMGNDVSPRRL